MKLRKIIILLIGFLGTAHLAIAQGNVITGTITDAKDGVGIPGVVVRIASLSDTSKAEGTVTDENGKFSISIANNGAYQLMATSLGYNTVKQTLSLSSGNKNIGTLKLVSNAISLKSVTIAGQQVRARQNGDTTSFNADAYKVNTDATAEDLVKKMPGITSDNDGLKANGEDVKRVLVDGKPFFGDDPNAALKNLPAEIIDRVEIFDNQSDQARFTGFNDGNQEKALNFVTKKGKNEGIFGKVYAGYGTSGKYQASATLNYFKGARRISLLGLSNNINQQNFSIADVMSVMSNSGSTGGPGGGGPPGGPGRMNNSSSTGSKNSATSFGGPGGLMTGQQNGITKTNALGLNFSDEWGKKIKVSGSYFFNATDNHNDAELLRNYFTDTALSYSQKSNTQTQNTNHRASLRLEYNINDNNTIIITPRITFQKNEYTSALNSITLQNGDTLNNTTAQQAALNKGYSFTNNILLQHKFQKKGRAISLNLGQQLSKSDGTGSYYSDTYYTTDSTHTILDQHYTNTSKSATFSGTFTYTEPVGQYGQVMANYNPSYTKSDADKQTTNPDGTGIAYDYLDTTLSNQYSSTYTTQRGGLSYRFSKQLWNLNVGMDVQQSVLNGDQVFPVAFTTHRTFSSILPSAMLNYKFGASRNLNVEYRASNTAPTITQLQSVPDVSNPLQVTTGNTDLQQTSEHQLRFRFSNVNKATTHSFFWFGMANYTANYISNATIIAQADTMIDGGYTLNTGSQLTKPVNLDNYYSLRTHVVYSLPLKSFKSNMNINAGINYAHSPALINGLLNYSNNITTNGGIYLGSNISQKIDFSLSYNGSYNMVHNTINSQSDNSYYNGNATFRANILLANRMVLNTDITHTLYSGLSESFNQSFFLWNAYVGYKFLKDRSLEVKASVFDLLNQNRSVSRTINETYTQDTRTNVLHRYGMVTLTYTIRKFKGTSAEPESRLPKDMPPLPPQGMMPPTGGG